jgi:hypothetical protein
LEKSFDADADADSEAGGFVVEVEAGRGSRITSPSKTSSRRA